MVLIQPIQNTESRTVFLTNQMHGMRLGQGQEIAQIVCSQKLYFLL